MNPKLLIVLLVTFMSIQVQSQTDFNIRRKKLTPTSIDTTTERIFIYETPAAILYFRHKDVADLLNDSKSKTLLGNYPITTLQDTLQASTPRIQVKDILYYYTNSQRDSIYKVAVVSEQAKNLNQDFYFVGAALILNGKFMVLSKDQNSIVTKGLIAKKRTGMLGQQTLEFYFPKGKQFYYIITALGE